MYYIALDTNLQIVGVSTRLKNEMLVRQHNLKGCYFLSMVDCEVPDVLAEDLSESLKLGLVYNATLKINVFKQPIWQEITVTSNYENGTHIGYLVKMQDTNGNELKNTCAIYKKMKQGVLTMLNGFPVMSDYREKVANNQNSWLKRIK